MEESSRSDVMNNTIELKHGRVVDRPTLLEGLELDGDAIYFYDPEGKKMSVGIGELVQALADVERVNRDHKITCEAVITILEGI